MSCDPIDQWNVLQKQAESLRQVLDSDNFDSIEQVAQELLTSTELFFSTLDHSNTVLVEKVKTEGDDILKLVEQANAKVAELRSDVLLQFSSLSRGAKGVSAYKKNT